jgi:hypothetical protein
MNEIPCGNCKNYDPILGPGYKRTARGWCTRRSKYPAKEGPGQLFPDGVERVAAGSLAEPYIVLANMVSTTCTTAVRADYDPYEQKVGGVKAINNPDKPEKVTARSVREARTARNNTARSNAAKGNARKR